MKRLNKRFIAVFMAVVASLCLSMSAFAEGSGTANSAVVSGMTSVANDMTATLTSLIPIALGVVGIGIVVMFGVRKFKQLAK